MSKIDQEGLRFFTPVKRCLLQEVCGLMFVVLKKPHMGLGFRFLNKSCVGKLLNSSSVDECWGRGKHWNT